MASTSKSGAERHRPTRGNSREAILDAAAIEFAESGFEGARIERIARRAGYNKALVYRYYGDRTNLLQEVLRKQLARREELLATSPDELADSLRHWFRGTVAPEARDFVRLLQREALNDRGQPPVEARSRVRYYERHIERIRSLQESGDLDASIPARSLFVVMLAMIAWPACFPQLVRMIYGSNPEDPAFQREWETVLTWLAELVAEEDSVG